MWLGPSGSWSCLRSWGNKSRGTAIKPRMYSRKGSSWWTMATSCPWRGTSTEVGLGLGTQPSYPRPRNPEREEKARQGAERGGQRRGGSRPHGLPSTPLLGTPALPYPMALPEPLTHSAPSPQMTRVPAGAGRSATGTQGGLGPAPGAL